ncbi:alanine dehydrogenase [Vulgatibacter incomptus]|uniref:Alanine dehydrogenase n=1 Tax=Vulgatibacter incomptus TaxID=1391653 RepID=A0A0K1PDT3_9BACT|nr:alanine dehydrogenase [Vulgatibacter incomptus]AKU91667.1 Alanine dehydrogenase [Vulgatibacter incomptus]
MIVGVPKEIKVREYRVGMVPGFVRALTSRGHQVLVQKGAGLGSFISDDDYVAAGATMIETADEVWKRAEMIVKVKEPLAEEYERIQTGQTIYTFFHLAAVPALAKVLVEKKVTSIAYETIQLPNGSLPLLKPMSEVAGRLAVQVGAMSLFREKGGKGILLGGVPGVRRGRVTVIGGGAVGTNAAKMALGLGAEVTILDTNLERLGYLDDIFGGRVTTLFSNQHNIHRSVVESDLVVGAVLIPGAAAPKLVTEAMLKEMGEGSVVVDVAVDQGGCIETCVPTTHENPTFIKHGVVHYCVANMPGAVAQTSTYALNNATEPYGIKLAQLGAIEAIQSDKPLALGVNTYNGAVTYEAVATSLGMPYTPLAEALAGKVRA